jgi:N-acyl homoserine lactone hydrolase
VRASRNRGTGYRRGRPGRLGEGWDTRISESLFPDLGGEVIAHGIRGIVARPLTHQLAVLGLTPKDISKVILSHAHFDHTGNSNLFAKSSFIVQSAELDAMFGPDYAHFGYIPKLYERAYALRRTILSAQPASLQ